MKDRNPRYSLSTVLCSLFLGFTLGFLVCTRLYMGWDRGKFEEEVKRDFYYDNQPKDN